MSAALSAVGENSLMPGPEIDSMLINAQSGYQRTNKSWVLSRLLRDFDYWQPRQCNQLEEEKLQELKEQNASSKNRRADEDIRIALRVTVWRCKSATGVGCGDWVYWIGVVVTLVQLAIAVVPWGVHGEWMTFFITAVGTALAYLSAGLPQWWDEKVGVRRLKYTQSFKERKDVILTEGNGSHDALLILGCEGGMDLEALAAPQRELRAPMQNRLLSTALATLWIVFLISVAGYDQHSWYVIGVGMIGILHNVTVAGMKREPKAFGIDLEYERTFAAGKVMEVLWDVEEGYPGAGASMVEEFFPGKLFPREQRLWDYAERRQAAFKSMQKAQAKAQGEGIDAQEPRRWSMPPLRRPIGRKDDDDVPAEGEADVAEYMSVNKAAGTKGDTKDHLVQIHE